MTDAAPTPSDYPALTCQCGATTLTDRAAAHVLAGIVGARLLDFEPYGYDERQYGSPGFAAFHSTKSSGSRLNPSTATRSPARRSSSDLPESLP